MAAIDVMLVGGTRPNFVKLAPLTARLRTEPETFHTTIVNTGQHYDFEMAHVFFQDLDIPTPDIDLEVGSGTHGEQTAEVIKRMEKVLIEHRPDVLVVVGDVNSTMGAAIAASKIDVPVAHVEAGLRSFDRTMPEEINRIVTDVLSTWLFVTEQAGVDNLAREGTPEERIFLVGDIIVDAIMMVKKELEAGNMMKRLNLEEGRYVLVTLHRPSNVDDPRRLAGLVALLREIAGEMPVVFPVHPRTRKNLERFGISIEGITAIAPAGYVDFLSLMKHCRFVVSDSGGVQTESLIFGKRCFTLRDTTEKPVTVECGSNVLTGTNIEEARRLILSHIHATKDNGTSGISVPPLWDGQTAGRIADILKERSTK